MRTDLHKKELSRLKMVKKNYSSHKLNGVLTSDAVQFSNNPCLLRTPTFVWSEILYRLTVESALYHLLNLSYSGFAKRWRCQDPKTNL